MKQGGSLLQSKIGGMVCSHQECKIKLAYVVEVGKDAELALKLG
jgi:hypothetical protein